MTNGYSLYRIETNDEFLQNHSKNKRGQTSGKTQLQQRLSTLKSLYQLFIIFLNTVSKYKTQIQELEEKVAKYEKDKQMIENLFIDNIININTNEDENNR